MDIIVSEKIVRRIMREENLRVKSIKLRKYSSYEGEISPAAPNILERNFKADKINEKWVTDITEFRLPSGKVYLSPMIDCFDGAVISWTISTFPNAALVNSMLEEAIQSLREYDKPIIHTDRGVHYRCPGWIDKMESNEVIRFMSKKGCSTGNVACECFFWR